MRSEQAPQTLIALYDQMEARARADGLTRADCSMAPNSQLHQWIRANVRYRIETEWFIVFELSCRLGKDDGSQQWEEVRA